MTTITIGEVPASDKELALEKKYIHLLEQRIEVLEAKIAGTTIEAKSGTERSNGNDKKEADKKKGKGAKVQNSQSDGKDSDSEDEESGATSDKRIQFRMKRFNADGLSIEGPYDPTKITEQNKVKPTSAAASFMLYFDRTDGHYETEIKIEDAGLRALLQRKLKHYPEYHWENPRLSIYAPFAPIIHNWDELNSLAALPATETDDAAVRDLRLLLDAIKSAQEVKEYFENINSIKEGSSMMFDFLWTIFPPGEIVLIPNAFMREKQAFLVWDFVQVVDPVKPALILNLWAYDFDGSTNQFNRVAIEYRIEKFKGQKRINTLPCYPLKYHDPEKIDEVRGELIERGRRFQSLCVRERGDQMFEYEGSAYSRGSGMRQIFAESDGSSLDDSSTTSRRASFHVQPTGRQVNTKGRVMVDFGSYVRHVPTITMGDLRISNVTLDDECHCKTCMLDGGPHENQHYDWDEISAETARGEGYIFEEEQYMICSARVLGYHLTDKKWVELSVSEVKDIKQKASTDSFDKLQLAPKQKKLVRELVQSHGGDKRRDKAGQRLKMVDLAKGKGEGLVILLHGPPGVGKTLTAESVAQVTGKPLFSVGVGDISTNPSDVERLLETMFELASAWQAVMLFDEADVFLESRAATTDVTRVGLVSVLLRVLEYYQGILILTTNRIRSFDIAVQSRINLAIQFKDLTEKQKKAIFRNLINQLSDDDVENRHNMFRWIDEDDEAVNRFSQLNGRQIRNIVFSATSLAANRKSPLRLDDVNRMLDETFEFQHHLHEMTRIAREKNE